jgi:tetratricopeptide (TPR) repeat protein
MDSYQKVLYWRDRLAAAEKMSKEGNKQRAEVLYRQALDMTPELTEQEQITSVVHLADFYLANKNFAKAEPLYRRAAESYEKQFGPKNIIAAMCLRSLGDALEGLGKDSEATAIKSRSAEILSALP